VQLVSFDFETHPFQQGIKAPPPVCAGVAREVGKGVLLLKPEAREELKFILLSGETLVGANFAFDAVVACAEWPDLLPLFFDKYERGQVFDVLIAAALNAIAKGHFCLDPQTRGPMQKPPKRDGKPGAQTSFYSLDLCMWQCLGRADAKDNDEYKTRYHEFDGLPAAAWPEAARQYPCDDASNTLELALWQMQNCENLHFMAREAYAAFALQLATVHGVRTNPDAVDALEQKLTQRMADAKEHFGKLGLFDEKDGKKDGVLLKRMVALAYGAREDNPCVPCKGTGKVPSEKTGKPVQCKECSATGLIIAPGTPRNPPSMTNPYGALSANRDALAESGDETLEEFAGVSEIQTGLSRYVPFLRAGTERPICIDFNVVGAESDRTSANGVIQQVPRKGGFRECIVARPGTVLCSVDFSAVELSTFGEHLLEAVGWSKMADAINDGLDLHTKFAADSFLHRPYAEVKALVDAEDAETVNYRYMTKAANFGFGGLMGGAKFAFTKRKEGLRLCITAKTAPPCHDCAGKKGNKKCRLCHGRGFRCGVEKVTQWGKKPRPIPPTCVACILVGEDLRKRWLAQWPEVNEHIAWVKSLTDPSGTVHMKTPITGFVRAQMTASSASNHPFQHLAAVAGKEALKLISRACYVDTKSPLFGSRILIWAHDESILELPEELAHEAAHEQARLMVLGAQKVIRRVRISAEPALMSAWWKDAKARFVGGRLVPWEPKPAKAA
jgi:DNA polymerase-1